MSKWTFGSGRRRKRRRRYRALIAQWPAVVEPLREILGEDIDTRHWGNHYRSFCRKEAAGYRMILRVMQVSIEIGFGVFTALAFVRLAMQMLSLRDVSGAVVPIFPLFLLLAPCLLATSLALFWYRRRFNVIDTVALFTVATLAACVVATVAIPSLNREILTAVVAAVSLFYVGLVGCLLGFLVGKTAAVMMSRPAIVACIFGELGGILCTVGLDGCCFAGSEGRRELFGHIGRAADWIGELGKGDGGHAGTRVAQEVRQNFTDAAEHVRGLSAWVAMPQASTAKDLRREVATLLAITLAGQFHYLPRAAEARPLNEPTVLALVIAHGKRLAAAATPAVVLLIADRFGLLPDGLRGWLLTVSLLGLAVGVVLELSPRGLSSIKNAASLMNTKKEV
jgi:hypothetical protein